MDDWESHHRICVGLGFVLAAQSAETDSQMRFVRCAESMHTYTLVIATTTRRGKETKPDQNELNYNRHHHHTTTILWPFFWDHPGEPVLEENFWTLWCNGRLTEADTLTIRLGATPSGLSSAHLHHPPIFYRPDALPAAQPTVSKHWRQPAIAKNWFKSQQLERDNKWMNKWMCRKRKTLLNKWTSITSMGDVS